APPAAAAWPTVQAWRVAVRRVLRAEREAVPPALRERTGRFVRAVLEHHLPELDGACIGLYWPFRGELDLRALVDQLTERAADFALPVVTARGQPLAFRRWWPGMRLTRGVWNIPVPAEGPVVHPDVLLVPLLGHDAAGYRLGHGGGYYDRTLAAATPRPCAIGVGYAAGRLSSICPQAHDVPMDVIVTDEILVRYQGRGALRAAAVEARWAGSAVSSWPAAPGAAS
ncbi:MAG: 5-formyltetrahydrofolate cyclo-ligase, partial [Gammaproteobacteria bacterium]